MKRPQLPQLPKHVTQQCPAGHYFNEYARAGEPIWVPFVSLAFTGPQAMYRLAEIPESKLNGGSTMPAKVHSPGRHS